MSHSAAEPFFSTGWLARLMSSEQQHALGPDDVVIGAVRAQRLAAAILDAVEAVADRARQQHRGTALPSAFRRSANQPAPSWSISSNGPNFQL